MSNDDFFDFMVFWELMFPEDEEKTYECPSCDRVIKGNEKVPWIDKKNKIFKCPDCGELLQIELATGELVEVEDKEVREGEPQPQKEVISSKESPKGYFICKFCGKEFKRKDVYEVRDMTAESIYYKCFDCENKSRLEEEESRRKLEEDISKEVDASGICFPAGQLKSPEYFSRKFKEGNVIFYMDLITLDLESKCKKDVIWEMVGLFTGSGIVKDGKAFYKNLLFRESLGSTAIGQNIAIPHARADIEEDMVVSVAISKKGIDFDSLDGQLVRAFFMSACKQGTAVHFRFLAKVSRFLKDHEAREKLINLTSKEELFQFLKTNFLPFSEKEDKSKSVS